MTLGQRFARFVTDVVVRVPALWALFRRPLRAMFDRIAPTWEARRSPDAYASLEAALDRLPVRPSRVLDLGTGAGTAALFAARRFPDAEVVGVDVSPGMIEQARARLTPDLAPRLRFEVADAARLPFDEPFDLVLAANMIPFFDELARVVAPGGRVLFAFSRGPQTPIYVPAERLRRELSRRGFGRFEDVAAGPGTALLAVRTAGV